MTIVSSGCCNIFIFEILSTVPSGTFSGILFEMKKMADLEGRCEDYDMILDISSTPEKIKMITLIGLKCYYFHFFGIANVQKRP